jgi:hypothetical protein
MKRVDRGEVLGLADYESVREHFRARVIGEKKLRRVALGPSATAVFENHDTMLLQIQEMLRTERITRPAAVAHEIETYNELVPGQDELSCTVMIEIIDKDEREAFLRAVLGFEKHVWFVADGEHIRASALERGTSEERTTAVHYLKFQLPAPVAEAVRGGTASEVTLEVDHPAYAARVRLTRETLASLTDDLSET